MMTYTYKLKKVHQRRLLKLAKFLRERVPRRLLDMSWYMREDKNGHIHERANIDCGTPACALGWATAIFPQLKFKGGALDIYHGNVRTNDDGDPAEDFLASLISMTATTYLARLNERQRVRLRSSKGLSRKHS